MTEHPPVDSQSRVRHRPEVVQMTNNHEQQNVAPGPIPGEIFLGHSWHEGQRFEMFGIPSEGRVTRSIEVDSLAEIPRPGIIEL